MPIPERDHHVVEKPIVNLGDGLHGAAHKDDHIQKKQGVILVVFASSMCALLSTPVVYGVLLLDHSQGP